MPPVTRISDRPVRLRLAVAALCDASRGGFPKADPDSTLLRVLSDLNPMGDTPHPYGAMWDEIETFYTSNDWEKLCDERLTERLQQMSIKGFKSKKGKTITFEEIKNAMSRWTQYGWMDYEMNRAKKEQYAKGIAMASGTAAAGLFTRFVLGGFGSVLGGVMGEL